MFRHVQLRIGRLVLGEPLPPAIVEAARIQPGTLVAELPAGSFSRAERITLRLSPTGTLLVVEFAYGADADFERMIGNYVAWGAPERASERTGEASAETARWSDAETAFVLRRDVSGAVSRIVGELRDVR